ncbi:hypothetical protein ACFQ68_28315 [Amycolatopsis japonica]|uniref:hypothetical protein n=1 Tax=Amycolatopsis japonica TaxID=208439 RepID=UPI00366FC6A3
MPQPRQASVSAAAGYEWRLFAETEAHLYRRALLAPDLYWPPMLLAWCEEVRQDPLGHERTAIGAERIAAPSAAIRCARCGGLLRDANAAARGEGVRGGQA